MSTASTGAGRVTIHLQPRSTGDTVAAVTALPDCDVHRQLFDVQVPARYDGVVSVPGMAWVHMCGDCFPRFGAGLGRGRGQKLVPPDVRWDIGAFCPLDDTLLQQEPQGWSCPACGAAWDHAGERGWWLTAGTDLAVRLAAEDALQTAGLVAVEQRSTCPTCHGWVTFGHTDHARDHARDHAGDDATDPSGGRPGLGRWRAQLIATAILETALLCQLAGFVTGDLWAPRVPDATTFYPITGGLAAAAVAVGAGWWLTRWWRSWWRGWWPYRHNRPLDPMPNRPGPDIAGPDISVTGGGS